VLVPTTVSISTALSRRRHDLHSDAASVQVDRSLLRDWTSWASKAINSYTAAVLWDSFYPKACDVHSNAYSQVR